MAFENVNLPSSNHTTGKQGLKDKTKQRILRTADFIRKGNSRTKTIEMLETVEELSNVQAKRVYNATIQYLTPTEEESANIRLEIIETLREVISQGIEKGDKSAVVKALDILNKMMGNYTERIDANINGSINFGFNFGDSDEGEGEEND